MDGVVLLALEMPTARVVGWKRLKGSSHAKKERWFETTFQGSCVRVVISPWIVGRSYNEKHAHEEMLVRAGKVGLNCLPLNKLGADASP